MLENVPPTSQRVRKEAFGPVAVLSQVFRFRRGPRQGQRQRIRSPGRHIHPGYYQVQQAWDELEVGGVIIGEVPSWRVDHMPYGGVKESGLGREGIRYAIEDMTEIRLMVLRSQIRD